MIKYQATSPRYPAPTMRNVSHEWRGDIKWMWTTNIGQLLFVPVHLGANIVEFLVGAKYIVLIGVDSLSKLTNLGCDLADFYAHKVLLFVHYKELT